MSRNYSLLKIFFLMLVVISIIAFSGRFCFAASYFIEGFEGDPILLSRIRVHSTGIRFKPGTQDEIWMLDIKATGQGGDVNIAKIGIDPNARVYGYPPVPPMNFTVVLKVKGGTNGFSQDIRPPGSAQEVWELIVMMAGSDLKGSANAALPGFFPLLSWDPNQIGSGKVTDFRLGDANGPTLLDMRTISTYQTKEADITDPNNYNPASDYALLTYAVVFEPLPIYYRDADNDGYGDPNNKIRAQDQPPGYVQDSGDIDDTDPNIYPGAPELCDGKDNDINGIIDDPNVLTYADYYRDADGDGYGDPNNTQTACKQPDGYISIKGDCDDTDATINPSGIEVYDGIDNDCKSGPDDQCYFVVNLTAIGQEYMGAPQTAEVDFGLDWAFAGIIIDPNNWSVDSIVRLQLIDPLSGTITDPNSFNDNEYLVEDIREATGQTQIAWHIMVDIGDMADPDQSDYYPVLNWDPTNFGCTQLNGTDYIYQLRRGIGDSGKILINNMADTNLYQTMSQDGDTRQYFTILWKGIKIDIEIPKPSRQILPWPGMNPGGLGWPSFPLTGGFPGGSPFKAKSYYPPGISRPSFPGIFPGYAFPGGRYPGGTTGFNYFFKFPRLGIFSPVVNNWTGLYWTGSPGIGFPKTGWLYPNR